VTEMDLKSAGRRQDWERCPGFYTSSIGVVDEPAIWRKKDMDMGRISISPAWKMKSIWDADVMIKILLAVYLQSLMYQIRHSLSPEQIRNG